jgi:hypothetical protein
MSPRVTQVHHLKDFELELQFADDTVAQLDFRNRIQGRGGVFAPLQEVAYFAQVAVDPEAGTIVWPNGVDFCPDVLYAEATGSDTTVIASKSA